MGYQSRKRNYRSRRERDTIFFRNSRVILIFTLIALLILFYKNYYEIRGWVDGLF